MAPALSFYHKHILSKQGVHIFVNSDVTANELPDILYQNILHQLQVTNHQTRLFEREGANKGLVTVFAVDSLKNFSYISLKEYHFFQTAYKRQGVYLRNTEFLPEVKISSEIEVQKNKECKRKRDETDY
jgi:hypothetical protein